MAIPRTNEEREPLAVPRQGIPPLAQLLRRLKLCRTEFAGWSPECARKSEKEFLHP
jgi:hypothetical protein